MNGRQKTGVSLRPTENVQYNTTPDVSMRGGRTLFSYHTENSQPNYLKTDIDPNTGNYRSPTRPTNFEFELRLQTNNSANRLSGGSHLGGLDDARGSQCQVRATRRRRSCTGAGSIQPGWSVLRFEWKCERADSSNHTESGLHKWTRIAERTDQLARQPNARFYRRDTNFYARIHIQPFVGF